ncbi:MAG TPA: MFS transporter [Blastococcus sp.]|jgi:predicted MFS family arabinose efflux permease|nr:MFS transporter [Blastococcus sp.]
MSRRLVAVMAVATGVAVANTYYAQPLLHAIGAEFGIGPAASGLIVTVAQVGYAIGLVFLLPAGDLVERRRLITLTCLVTAVALAGAALAPTPPALFGAMAVVGLTSIVAQILVPFAASLATDEDRGSVVGTVMSGLLLGVLLARTVAGYISELWGWRTVYWFAAGLMLLTSAVLRRELPRYREQTGLTYPRLLASVVTILREEPVLRWRAVYGALSFGTFSVLWTSLAFLLGGPGYHMSEGTIGLFGLVGAAGAGMASLAGRITDRGGARLLTGATSACLLLSWIAIWLGAHSLAALLVGIVLLDVGAQGLHITNQSEIYRLRPDARSRINAAYMTSYFVGGAVGSAGSAVAFGAFGWTGVSVWGAAFAAAAAVIWTVRSWAHRSGVAAAAAGQPARGAEGNDRTGSVVGVDR